MVRESRFVQTAQCNLWFLTQPKFFTRLEWKRLPAVNSRIAPLYIYICPNDALNNFIWLPTRAQMVECSLKKIFHFQIILLKKLKNSFLLLDFKIKKKIINLLSIFNIAFIYAVQVNIILASDSLNRIKIDFC